MLKVVVIALLLFSFNYSAYSLEVDKQEKIPVNHKLSLKLGGFITWGHYSDYYTISTPYIGISWRGIPLRNSKNWIGEIELGFFTMNGNNGTVNVNSTGMPITFSLVRPIKLSSKFELNPKLGFGFLLLHSSSSNQSSGMTPFFLIKPAVEVVYQITESIGILLDNSFMTAIEDGVSFYYTPSLGVSYRF